MRLCSLVLISTTPQVNCLEINSKITPMTNCLLMLDSEICQIETILSCNKKTKLSNSNQYCSFITLMFKLITNSCQIYADKQG
jgi:hypothetical protein